MLPFDVLKMAKNNGGGSGGGSFAEVFNIYAEKGLMGVGSTQATVSFSMNSDGTCTASEFGSPAYWYDPITTGIGASYWVIVTVTSGTVSSGNVGSRVSLSSGQTWTATTIGTAMSRSRIVEGTVQIWDASTGGNKVAEGTFYLEASVDNS